jgi:hypothetical protein
MDYTSIKVGQLPSAAIAGTNLIPHEVGGLLKKATITDLAAFISANGAVGFRAVSVPNGGTLPSTTQQEFILVGPGTYNNVGGGSPVTVTEELNALVSNGTFWFIGVQIPIDPVSGGTANWGGITGTLSAQTDLQAALNAKQPSSADLTSIAGLTGTSGLLRKTAANTYSLDTNSYLPLSGGTLASSGSTNTLNINHSSGSGVAASITKGGNGEALTVVKSSGSGNAASITGGVTLLTELNLTTKLADAHINSAATWNSKQNALVSGTNIKTINGNSLLGSGDITISGGSTDPLEFNTTDRTVWNNGKGNVATNTSFGESALKSNTTGGNNVAIGNSSLFSNTTGTYNLAVGGSSLFNNTTGGANIAIGELALQANTTGNHNVAVGLNSLVSNTTGTNNVGIGANALGTLTTGINNTAIGAVAGAFAGTTADDNTTSNTSVFIGAGTRPLANNQTNQIVIGNSAIGHGSNTVTLGNSSIVTTILRGNVGIGTTSPAFKLDVIGKLRLTGTGYDTINSAEFEISNTTAGTGRNWVVNSSNGGLFQIADKTAGGQTRFVIDLSGNVGIGTTSPTQKLDVNGLINSTNGISVGGSGVSVVWTGTQAAYDAIATKSSTTIYFIQ